MPCRCHWRSAFSDCFGFSGRRDHHEAQLALLEELAPSWPEDWWFLGYLGWAQIETGAVASGTRLVEHSLALNPRNAHGAHQRAHGSFETGDPDGARVGPLTARLLLDHRRVRCDHRRRSAAYIWTAGPIRVRVNIHGSDTKG